MDGNDEEDNLSQALEYQNSLRHKLIFETWDQELEGEATGLSGGALADDCGWSERKMRHGAQRGRCTRV
jgi:hypothetical protein